ncbi:MAG: nucleotidyltransferase domain-containing protein [Chloroflexi bacterium]|nr:nucleotidyltransferase domain-containing protein [Chloroflexota bacterium]
MNENLIHAEQLEPDIRRAINILKTSGCAEVFLFGSAARGNVRPDSDLDLAVRGCPPGQFFHILGQLLIELEHPVDLVNLDSSDAFANRLQEEGALVRIS